jgi:hypothetical protein
MSWEEADKIRRENEPPSNVIGRLPEFACSHWTGYGIESELCQNYLHALSALRRVKELFAEPSPFFIKKLGAPITNADQERIDKTFIAIENAIAKSEKP